MKAGNFSESKQLKVFKKKVTSNAVKVNHQSSFMVDDGYIASLAFLLFPLC
jgi:hypothetical protein